MSCEEFGLRVSKLLDNALENDLLSDVFTHLGLCERCREFYKSTMEIRRALQGAPPLPMSEAMDRDIVSFSTTRAPYAPDASPARLASRKDSARSSIRTVLLAVLLLVIGCLIFSMSISINVPHAGPGLSPAQSSRNAGIR